VKQCFVLAPWAGRVSKVHVHQHMSVNPGQPMVDLVMSGPLKIRVNLPSSVLSRIRPGHVFDVRIDETGQTYKARITAINSRVDAVSQTIEAEAMMVSQYPGLLAGMSGTARLGVR
jgi:membrane fusion protein, multidrug efflux system